MVESSEQGMLSEVDRAIHKSEWIVFLGWSPHPMNLKYRMQYLAGGDDTFGANYGGATIYTDVRAGYLAECPNVGTAPEESPIHSRHRKPDDGADSRRSPRGPRRGDEVPHRSISRCSTAWLDGVTTVRRPTRAAHAVRRELTASSRGASTRSAARRPTNGWSAHKIPLGQLAERRWCNYATGHAQGFFDLVSDTLGRMITALTVLLMRDSGAASSSLAVAAVRLPGLQRKVSLTLFILGRCC